jgi:anti-sigma B factor antagonist
MAANPIPLPSRTLTVSVSTSDGFPTLHFHGRITRDTSDLFKSEVKQLVPAAKRIVVDFCDVNYVDSSGLGTIVGTYISARTAGCDVKFVNFSQRVKELLQLTRLASVFEGYGEYL